MTYWNVWDKERLIVKKLKNAGVLGKDDVHFSSHWLRASRAVHLFNLEIGTFSNYITDKSIFECQRHIC